MKLLKEIGSSLKVEVEVVEYLPRDRSEPIRLSIVGEDHNSLWISKDKAAELGIICNLVMIRCPNCEGDGKDWHGKTCTVCGGLGTIKGEQVE